jgi:hypothetical protein
MSGVQQTATLSGRQWAWLWIASIVICSVNFVGSVRDGRDTAAVWWTITALVGIWLLVRSLRPQGPRTWSRWHGLRAAVLLDLFFLTTGTMAVVKATRVSGGGRVFYIFGAVVLLVALAVGIVQTVRTYRMTAPIAENQDENTGSDEAP